ncbi:BirA family transcriptional regulator, biotin operon repressor; biotin-[acetyl-CoA-carboxylase] ligase [Candidatus Electrothrix marina]|uniref:BirA family transcriptional regulator, biotin operon repressor n=1 Tax=Candidatus Electrothrix marina TaxID=1859130 RepID=A0A3S3QTQ0_9BACT|nr:BirA family transcriptional regulator, biotin operon repressor; biotin-[acetyl-CoA-carboxylase] ligase [Candidatus Electrothrix marina]
MSSPLQRIREYRQAFLRRLDTHSFAPPTVEKILAYGAPVGAIIEHHTRLDRCMDRLRQLIREEEKQGRVLAAGTVVLADTLTESSGRFDRVWHAPEGGIWLAMAWPDILLPEFTRLLPFAAGAACCRTVRQYGVNARLKWVNDVLVAGKKLAGILCTTVQSPGGDRYHLLGIGINGNNQVFPAELQDTATCLRSELSRLIALTELTGRLLAELQWSIGLLHYDEEQSLAEGLTCGEGRASLLLTAWQELSDTVGQQVKYGFDVQQKTLYRAVAREIDPCGGLVMELEDGSRVTEYSGEIFYL